MSTPWVALGAATPAAASLGQHHQETPRDGIQPRMHSLLGHTPGNSDTSPPTSPPSSAAPFSDDEFTSLVLRRAAQRLGVEYSPGRWRGQLGHSTSMHPGISHRSVSQPPVPPGILRSPPQMPDRDRATLLAMSRTQQLPAPGPQTWALYGECTVEDIAAMIDIRQRALGPNHPSLAPLYDVMGDRCDIDGQPQVARSQYETALKLMPRDSNDRVGILGKLGHLMLQIGEPLQAAEYFERAALFSRTGKETAANDEAAADNADQTPPEPAEVLRRRAAEEARAEHLQQLLTNGADSQEARREIAEALLRVRSAGDPAPTKAEASLQTDAEVEHGADPVHLPPRHHLTAEQLARIRAPTTRGTADLRSLLAYVSDGRRADAAATTAATIDAVRKRMAIPASAVSVSKSGTGGGVEATPANHTGTAQTRLASSVQKLNSVISRVRGRATERTDDGTHRHMSPEERTEREVARMLLESSVAASPSP